VGKDLKIEFQPRPPQHPFIAEIEDTEFEQVDYLPLLCLRKAIRS
jgi:hypothetical protein